MAEQLFQDRLGTPPPRGRPPRVPRGAVVQASVAGSFAFDHPGGEVLEERLPLPHSPTASVRSKSSVATVDLVRRSTPMGTGSGGFAANVRILPGDAPRARTPKPHSLGNSPAAEHLRGTPVPCAPLRLPLSAAPPPPSDQLNGSERPPESDGGSEATVQRRQGSRGGPRLGPPPRPQQGPGQEVARPASISGQVDDAPEGADQSPCKPAIADGAEHPGAAGSTNPEQLAPPLQQHEPPVPPPEQEALPAQPEPQQPPGQPQQQQLQQQLQQEAPEQLPQAPAEQPMPMSPTSTRSESGQPEAEAANAKQSAGLQLQAAEAREEPKPEQEDREATAMCPSPSIHQGYASLRGVQAEEEPLAPLQEAEDEETDAPDFDFCFVFKHPDRFAFCDIHHRRPMKRWCPDSGEDLPQLAHPIGELECRHCHNTLDQERPEGFYFSEEMVRLTKKVLCQTCRTISDPEEKECSRKLPAARAMYERLKKAHTQGRSFVKPFTFTKAGHLVSPAWSQASNSKEQLAAQKGKHHRWSSMWSRMMSQPLLSQEEQKVSGNLERQPSQHEEKEKQPQAGRGLSRGRGLRTSRSAILDDSVVYDAVLRNMLLLDYDRTHVKMEGEIRTLVDLRNTTLSMMQNFFESKVYGVEAYKTFMFSSISGDELWLCVKAEEQFIRKHADDSDLLVRLSREALEGPADASEGIAGLGIKVADPVRPAWLKYDKYMAVNNWLQEYDREHQPSTGPKSILRKIDRIRLVYDHVTDHIDLVGLQHWGVLHSYFPVHTKQALSSLERGWAGPWNFWQLRHPLQGIQDYFGSQVALYFVYVEQLNIAMTFLCIASLVVVIYERFFIFRTSDGARLVLATFTILWNMGLTRLVEREVERKMNEWGDDAPDEGTVKNPDNPRFRGTMVRWELDMNQWTNDATPTSKAWGRFASNAIFLACVLCSFFCTLFLYFLKTLYRIHRESSYATFAKWLPYLVTVQIKVFELLWDNYLQQFCLDLEQLKDMRAYCDQLIFKTFIFKFVNAFNAILYLTFGDEIVADFWAKEGPHRFAENGCAEPADDNDEDWQQVIYQLRVTYAVYIGFSFYDAVVPKLVYMYRAWHEQAVGAQRQEADDDEEVQEEEKEEEAEEAAARAMASTTSEAARATPSTTAQQPHWTAMSFLEHQGSMEEYDLVSIRMDFIEIIMPLAFVLLFNLCTPEASVLVLLCNSIQVRSDAMKLTRSSQRPIPATSVGLPFLSLLRMLTFIAIFVNVALVVFRLQLFPDYAGCWAKLALFLLLENAAMFMMWILEALCPAVPADVVLSRRQQQRQRSVAFGLLETESDAGVELVVRAQGVKIEHLRSLEDGPYFERP